MATKTLSSKTGFGAMDEDRNNGIYTLASKLDNLCPCYQWMDNLNRKRPNVKPLREKAGGDDDTSQDSSEDDIDDIESTFVDKRWRDGDNSNIDRRVLEEPTLNPPDVNVNDVLDLDGFDDMADINNTDQDNMDDPEIVQVPPRADSTPGQQVHEPASLKQRHSKTESNTSRKSRATDTHKAPPKLVQGSTQSPRNGFASAFLESSVSKLEVLKEVEEKKLEQERDSTARQLELDRKRMESEERKLEAEKEQAERKLEAEQRSKDRRIGLEEKRLQWEKERSEAETDIKYKVQMAILVQSVMSNGYKLEDIEKIMAMVTKK
ncbi:hypothetical protein BG003_011974 [Podila horticola]|nr:hypothetical protein BG003_011974 [Podila horticola]